MSFLERALKLRGKSKEDEEISLLCVVPSASTTLSINRTRSLQFCSRSPQGTTVRLKSALRLVDNQWLDDGIVEFGLMSVYLVCYEDWTPANFSDL